MSARESILNPKLRRTIPFHLHPSGYCSWSSDKSIENLQPGKPCIFCFLVAGHHIECPLYTTTLTQSSSRGKLFDAVSILWARSPDKSFITFTLPSLDNGTYQRHSLCKETGDKVIGSYFSRTLEAWKLKEKRRGVNLSYVWVSEAQMKRQQKFGGIGDIHYHMVVNKKLKHSNKKFCDRETFDWVQNNWCDQIGVRANNCVHVDPLPDDIRGIPGYLTKYFGKGQCRTIVSRRFQASQDLTAFAPIALDTLPDVTLINERIYTTPDGFDVIQRYYNTREVLELYGSHMRDQELMNVSRGNGESLTVHSKYLDQNDRLRKSLARVSAAG